MSTQETNDEIATRAEELKIAFLGVSLAMPALLDPRTPLLDIYCRLYGKRPDSPVEIGRLDGSFHSADPIGAVLARVAALQHGGRKDVLTFAGMHGATRIGDSLLRADLVRNGEPLLQFARHLRNACAHGNLWHFGHGEPKHPAELRGRRLDASLHGSKALYGWVAPGDYLDYLDDLADFLRRP